VVEIPSKIDGLSVTFVGTFAFASCSNLTSVTVQDSVARGYQGAFIWCGHLIKITRHNGQVEYTYGCRPTAIWTNAPVENELPEESVCECRDPFEEVEKMQEWLKVEARLEEKGIYESVATSLSHAIFCVPHNQANDAREIIRQMVKDKEVDSERLQLQVISNSLITTMSPPVWTNAPSSSGKSE